MPDLDLNQLARAVYLLWGYPAQLMVMDNTHKPAEFFEMHGGIYFTAVELPPDQVFRYAVELPSPVVAISEFVREPVRSWLGDRWE